MRRREECDGEMQMQSMFEAGEGWAWGDIGVHRWSRWKVGGWRVSDYSGSTTHFNFWGRRRRFWGNRLGPETRENETRESETGRKTQGAGPERGPVASPIPTEPRRDNKNDSKGGSKEKRPDDKEQLNH